MNVIERRRLYFFGAWRWGFATTRGFVIEEEDGCTDQQSVGHADSSIRVVSAKIKSRTQIRRADKIELKMVIGFRRKSLLLNILILRNIYRFSRESRELNQVVWNQLLVA